MFDVFIFAGVIFLVSRKLAIIFPPPTATSSMLPGDSLPRQDKLFYLIDWHRLTLVLYENHIASRPGCGVGVCLPSLYRQGFLRRASTGLKGINPGCNLVLTCR